MNATKQQASALDIYTFGAELVKSQDLDPLYVILWEWIQTEVRKESIKKWLLAYFAFYHAGTASWILDQPSYWAAMMTAAESSAYPRSSERRHFRAKNAITSVEWLAEAGIDNLFDPFLQGPMAVEDVMAEVKTWRGFGPWIAFKVADMLDRLGLCQVAFDTGSAFLFDSPKKAAYALAEQELDPEAREAIERDEGIPSWAVDQILAHEKLWTLTAPPRHERKLNVQEAETILCKYKAYLSGHYPIGKDTHEIRHGLLRFARSYTAQQLLKAGKRGKLWS